LFKLAIPVLHVRNTAAAEDFYCNRLGFRRDFVYRADEVNPDPCYMGLVRDHAQIHVSSFSGDGVAGGVAYLLVEDIDRLHEELLRKNVSILLEPTDQTWGNREMYVQDPDGNNIRFGSRRCG
jgi:catechol 2,3-dioxygenase-like lactoylglutathione lyase family enzyme